MYILQHLCFIGIVGRTEIVGFYFFNSLVLYLELVRFTSYVYMYMNYVYFGILVYVEKTPFLP